MKIIKPKFWEKKQSYFLYFITCFLFLQIIIKIKNKFISPQSYKLPIICVGNIYLGGTGKTPLVIEIAKELKKKNKPAIIKKFYSEHFDEHELINKNVNCLITDKSRRKAIKSAEEKNYDIVILDDGFQDHSIKKDLNILCFNSRQLIGNGMTLPSGPLRESINSVKGSQIIIINGDKNENFEKKILDISKNIKIFYSKYLLTEDSSFKNKNVFAFAGIGNPSNFFYILEKNNFNIKKNLFFLIIMILIKRKLKK